MNRPPSAVYHGVSFPGIRLRRRANAAGSPFHIILPACFMTVKLKARLFQPDLRLFYGNLDKTPQLSVFKAAQNDLKRRAVFSCSCVLLLRQARFAVSGINQARRRACQAIWYCP